MDASLIKDVADWMKTADLAEVVYRKNGTGFSLTALGAHDPAQLSAPAMPSGRFFPVASDGVGVFQWNAPGKARKADEGVELAAGDVIGVIVSGSGASKPIVAPQSGRVAKLFIDAGQAVEYGQPLILLESR
ncbi:MAG: biotin/lipoyl-containing protein [Elusimicrobiota bacterium]|nr:biotin/lipoyl-containing protein [Elusimicrobiota bacterium]